MLKIIQKPWGGEVIIEQNDKYVIKRIFMKKNHKCSEQYHEKKKETIYILSGVLFISTKNKDGDISMDNFSPDDMITIEPRTIHRMEGITDCLYLEVSTPELNDVVRIKDDYGRK